MSNNIITPEARLAYPALFVPTAMEEGQEKKYGCVLIFDLNADLAPLKKAALEAATEKWGDKAVAMFQNKQLRNPFRDCSEKSDKQGFEGKGYFITVRNSTKPGVVDQNLAPILDPADVFGGLIVRASLKSFAYDRSGNRGVGFSLQNLMVVKNDGTRWDGRKAAEDEFAAFRSKEAATAGGEVKSTADIF